MKSFNQLGESEFSQSSRIITTIEIGDIPAAESPRYDFNTGSVTFNLLKTELPLMALVDVRGEGTGWRTYQSLPITATVEELTLPEEDGIVDELRVRLCLTSNISLCSEPVQAIFSKLLIKNSPRKFLH